MSRLLYHRKGDVGMFGGEIDGCEQKMSGKKVTYSVF